MSGILRGQQGFPTGPGRRAAGPADPGDIASLPGPDDWQQAERAEAAVEATRNALARSQDDESAGASDDPAELVDRAREIESDVAPGRDPGGDEPPTPESAND